MCSTHAYKLTYSSCVSGGRLLSLCAADCFIIGSIATPMSGSRQLQQWQNDRLSHQISSWVLP